VQGAGCPTGDQERRRVPSGAGIGLRPDSRPQPVPHAGTLGEREIHRPDQEDDRLPVRPIIPWTP